MLSPQPDKPVTKQPLKDASNDLIHNKHEKQNSTPQGKGVKSSKDQGRSPILIPGTDDTSYTDTFDDSQSSKEQENKDQKSSKGMK